MPGRSGRCSSSWWSGRRLAVLVVLCAASWATACGGGREAAGGPNGTVRFDATRRLSGAARRAIDRVSGVSAAIPTNLTARDLMSSVTTPWRGFDDRATEQAFNAQLAAAKHAAARFATARAAQSAGYVFTSYFIPNFGTHWVDWAQVLRPFDPARPAMLLYDGEGRDAHLIGLSYYVRGPNGVPPAGFAGDNDRWHRHFGTCYAGGFLVGENISTRDVCRKICEARASGVIRAPVGTEAESPEIDRYLRTHPAAAPAVRGCDLVPGDDLWMLHLWIVPGHPNPNGMFSTFNPSVTACALECRPS